MALHGHTLNIIVTRGLPLGMYLCLFSSGKALTQGKRRTSSFLNVSRTTCSPRTGTVLTSAYISQLYVFLHFLHIPIMQKMPQMVKKKCRLFTKCSCQLHVQLFVDVSMHTNAGMSNESSVANLEDKKKKKDCKLKEERRRRMFHVLPFGCMVLLFHDTQSKIL